MLKLADKTAIITGASQGIGRAVAQRFYAEGANLVLSSLPEHGTAENVIKQIGASEDRVLVVEGDAVLAPADGVRNGVPVPAGGRWTIPGTADCRACHEGQPNPVLGFTALQLSSDRDPGALHAGTPHAEMHVEDLVARGLLRGLPRALVATPPRIATGSADERAALGYLHANCGICHNRHGPLAGIGLDLLQALSEGPASVERTRASALAVRALRPIGGAEVRVEPGKPEHSVLFRRMGARDPLDQMPPLGTEKPDREALALVERWIHSLADRRTP